MHHAHSRKLMYNIDTQCVHAWVRSPLPLWKLNRREKYELEVGDNKPSWIKFTVTYIENLILDTGRGNCLDITQRGSNELQYLSRDEHFSI